MGLSQALFSGMSGLITHNRCMDNIGNNLANVNTVGFKKGVFQFSTLFEQTYAGGMGPSTGRGSINPLTLGLGTTTGSIDKDFRQAGLETTNNPYDFAIEGNGFFVLQTGATPSSYSMTRDGTFYLGQLVSPGGVKESVLMGGNGLPVLGYRTNEWGVIPDAAPLSSLAIEIGSVGGARATSSITLGGNINKNQPVALGTRIGGGSITTPPSWLGTDIVASDSTWIVANKAAADEIPVLINGGNVQTSAPLGQLVWAVPKNAAGAPDFSNEGAIQRVYISLDSVANPNNFANYVYYTVGYGQSTMEDKANLIASGGSREQAQQMGMQTNLRDVYYFNGSSWVRPFADIKNGDVITMQYSLGTAVGSAISQTGLRIVTTEFVYNNPSETNPSTLKNTLSSTLNDWMTYLTGAVDDPTVVARYVPAGQVTVGGETINLYKAEQGTNWVIDYQGLRRDPSSGAYLNANGAVVATAAQAARGSLVQDTSFDAARLVDNQRLTGGAMGTVKLQPHISGENGGVNMYDVPPESAGTYTRVGYDQILYNQSDSSVQNTFNMSILSNLGAENAFSNVEILFNGMRHDNFFKDDKVYNDRTGGGTATTLDLYDSVGTKYVGNMRLTLVDRDTNFSTWRWYSDSDADTDNVWQSDEFGNINTNAFTGTGLIRFDSDGKIIPTFDLSETGGIVVDRVLEGTRNPITVSLIEGAPTTYVQALNFRYVSQVDTLSNFGEKEQDGRPAGTLGSFTVGADGLIEGIYSNGVSSTLGAIALAMVPNNTGLVAVGGNMFRQSIASGATTIAKADTGGRGIIRQGELETSNVELAEEFTKLITTERGFQANARTISTVDSMLQEIINLKR